MRLALAVVLAAAPALAGTGAVPAKTPTRSRAIPAAAPAPHGDASGEIKPRLDGAHARVAFGQAGVLRPAREVVGRREEPLTPEEATAKQIESLLRGPLRYSVTGVFVADARTGEPLFAVNADDPLNPASNVKMISTATALELLGPDFRYPTRLLGPEPDDLGTIRGNVYLLGSWDPTLAASDLDDIAAQLAARGVRELDGDVVVGRDPTRDAIYRATLPIEIRAGAPGEPPIATPPAGFDLVTFKIAATTARTVRRAALGYAAETITDPAGHLRVQLSITGTLGKGATLVYPLEVAERTAFAGHALRAALRAHQIAITGDVKLEELGDFIGDAVQSGALPIELGRHESAPLAEIIAHVNKWSINWLADRIVMTAAGLAHRQPPSMALAVEAMYGWLARHVHLDKADLLVDTGSGLSYQTRITAHELVSIVRCAAGYVPDSDPAVARAWLGSLSIGGTDGTLGRRFRAPEVRGRLFGKTGTLSTVIALSGVLEVDPARPLAFSIVTNGDRPLAKGYVRKAHEQLIGLITKYLATTAKSSIAPAPTRTTPAERAPEDLDEAETPDPQLDAETAGDK
ncbi:MAG TPA: D-alanyl-D-alanine carboxypeptidase [Kofleriaceae bacterium]|nr:D-alanyl-D-alanine carboxypeptidase [Kofleriaceae bacterium]